MKLFGRTSGYYLFWTGFVYFWVGMYLAFTHTSYSEFATLGFILALSVPLWCPPVARHFNMEPMMFDWFKKPDYSNVVKFPEAKETPKMPYIVPPSNPAPPKEPDAKTFYWLGLTNNNRVAFNMGHMEITMNHEGCQQMIDQLKFFQSQLKEEDAE